MRQLVLSVHLDQEPRVTSGSPKPADSKPLDQEPLVTTGGLPIGYLARTMPIKYPGYHSGHCTKLDELYEPFQCSAVEMNEVQSSPAAKAAIDREWKRLQYLKCWDVLGSGR